MPPTRRRASHRQTATQEPSTVLASAGSAEAKSWPGWTYTSRRSVRTPRGQAGPGSRARPLGRASATGSATQGGGGASRRARAVERRRGVRREQLEQLAVERLDAGLLGQQPEQRDRA